MAAVSEEAKARAKVRYRKWDKKNNYHCTYNKIARTKPDKWIMAAIRACRSRAKRKGLEFDMDRNDLSLPDICPVLGIPIILGLGGQTPSPNAPSVDRFDNTKGYIKGNVNIISHRANALKRDATLEEMRAVVRYMESKNEVR